MSFVDTTVTPTSTRPLRIALIAGEASGDQLGADLINSLRQRHPDAQIVGVGGTQMQAAGMELWSDYRPLAVMGLAEVLRHLPRLLRFRRQIVRRLIDWQPDVFIGIDAPDFNLGVERRLRQTGVTTVHYVSPSVWAWREGRAARIGDCADRVLCLFPMEPAIYSRHGVDARFVGHPIANRFPDRPDQDAARHHLGLPLEATLLAILPGSRLGELGRLLPVFLPVAERLLEQRPDLQVLIPAANADCAARLQTEPLIQATTERGASRRIHVLDGQAHAALFAADAVLLASGTAALEAALAKRPMVVAYRIAALTYFLVTTLGLLKIERYSLPNILHGGDLVPEFMQHECTPERLLPAIETLLDDPQAGSRQLAGFDAIQRSLQVAGGAGPAAAAAVLDLIESKQGLQP